jgi:hypothetical protein
VCFGAGFRACCAWGVRFLADAICRRTGRFLAVRFFLEDGFADRLAGARRATRRAGFARFAAFFAFKLFRFAIASILSEP